MSKELKVIECPKCGSTQNIEIRPGHYRCKNCNTAYFLDDDDITYDINSPQNDRKSNSLNLIRKNLPILLLMLVMILVFILPKLFHSNDTTKSKTIADIALNEPKPSWSGKAIMSFANGEGKPIVLVVGVKDYHQHNAAENFYVDLFDASTNENLKSSKLVGINPLPSSNINIRTFSDGKIYFIVNHTKIFEFNAVNYSVRDITKTLFQENSDFDLGLAKIEFVQPDNGDGLKILTNDGKELYFYPTVNKSYTHKQWWEACKGFKNLLPGATDKLGFRFTSYVPGENNDTYQLIKYTYKDNGTGPKNQATFGWAKEYFMDSSSPGGMSYKKVLLTEFYKNHGRIISYKDFTPGRNYLKPETLYNDDNILLLFFGVTAAENSPIAIQCMDAKTGAILFTTKLPAKSYLKRATTYNGGILVDGIHNIYNLSTKGDLTNTFSLR